MRKSEQKRTSPNKKGAAPANDRHGAETHVTKPKTPRLLDAEAARLAAVEHCFFHYPTLYTSWNPRRSSDGDAWIVSIVLTDPDYGVVGEVGEIQIDARSGHVIRSTQPDDVVAAGKQLYEAKHDALEAAAALRARKA